MAFQDFDQLAQRRQMHRRQRLKRRIIIGLVVTFVVLLVVGVVGVVMHVHKEQDAPEADDKNSPNAPDLVQKEVDAVCARTDYKNICQDRLRKALGKNNAPKPKDILKAAVSAPADEIKKAVKKVSGLKYKNAPMKQAAAEDCVELLNGALKELTETIGTIPRTDLAEQSPQKVADLNIKLSAVLSNQQTCIDGFPEGKEKAEMEKTLKDAKTLSRNALAIISRAPPRTTKGSSPQRKLLSSTWMHSEINKRLLKENAPEKAAPNVTVAKDGSGKFDTVSAALKAMPKKYTGRYVIYVKEGVYEENVVVDKKMANVTIYGDGSEKTIVSGSKSYADGATVYQSATFAVLGNGFNGKFIGFRNTAGPEKNQSVALRVQADHSIFIECSIEGYQNALFTQSHRQFYRSCDIAGTVDIIFGDAAAVFQNCKIHVRKPLENQSNTVTAQARIDKRESTGIVIQNSRILAADDLEPEKMKFKSYLGRPWKEFSRAIVMETQIGDVIQPAGWLVEAKAGKTAYMAEFENQGAGRKTSGRVKSAGVKVMRKEEAVNFTVGVFLQGEELDQGSRNSSSVRVVQLIHGP